MPTDFLKQNIIYIDSVVVVLETFGDISIAAIVSRILKNYFCIQKRSPIKFLIILLLITFCHEQFNKWCNDEDGGSGPIHTLGKFKFKKSLHKIK